MGERVRRDEWWRGRGGINGEEERRGDVFSDGAVDN